MTWSRYVRGPGVAVGTLSLLPTTHLDITVTVLELAGATHGPHTPANLDGLSFAAALAPTPAAAKLRERGVSLLSCGPFGLRFIYCVTPALRK
jgi:arylsulfatase A-like enzyme